MVKIDKFFFTAFWSIGPRAAISHHFVSPVKSDRMKSNLTLNQGQSLTLGQRLGEVEVDRAAYHTIRSDETNSYIVVIFIRLPLLLES